MSRIDPVSISRDVQLFRKSRFPILIGIGSLIEVKRVDRFIDWLIALTSAGVQYHAVWLGDGPLRSILEDKAKNASIEIMWCGHVDAANVADELAKADVMLMTSEFEVLPLAVLEAMAKSKPVITTHFFGVSDFICDQVNGIVVPFDLPLSDVAKKIANLLSNKQLCVSMGEKSKEIFIEKFSGANQMAAEYVCHYRFY